MATALSPVDSRNVVRCDLCFLVQFPSTSTLCRRCHRPLEPEPQLVPQAAPAPVATLASTLRELRLRAGLSQRQLAKRFEPKPVPRTYVSKIENGLDTPTISTLVRLARALEVTVPELLDAKESSRRGTIAALMDDVFVAQVAPFVSRLSPMQMASVLAQVHDMAARQQRLAFGSRARGLQFSGVAVAKVVA